MAWYSRDDHNSADVVDEASVGLIEPKQGPTTRPSTKQRHSWISTPFVGVLLVVSNIAWAGSCLMLWRKLHLPPNVAVASHDDFGTDFGISTFYT
jgi:hypothetical protein